MIELRHLRKEYDIVTPLEDVSVTINDGDVISIIGPSGTGKSTLIRCINLLETPTSGQVIFNGEDITAKGYDIRKARMHMGMVFQSFNLFGHLTVIENLMLAPMDLQKKSRQEAYDKGMELLDRVGLAEKALSYPDELSGGQKQRVAIARTLCMDPEVILLDEPTSALDPTMVSEVQAVIRELSKSGKTMMIVTHELNFARAISNRVFFMDEGGIYEDGTPEQIFEDPKREHTRQFIHRLKIFETHIDNMNHDFIRFGIDIDQYLMQNDVAPMQKSHVRLSTEELIWQILLPRLYDPHITVKVEYSMQDMCCKVIVTYNGDMFNIKDGGNSLSLMMLNNTAEEIRYSYELGSDEPNRVDIMIK